MVVMTILNQLFLLIEQVEVYKSMIKNFSGMVEGFPLVFISITLNIQSQITVVPLQLFTR